MRTESLTKSRRTRLWIIALSVFSMMLATYSAHAVTVVTLGEPGVLGEPRFTYLNGHRIFELADGSRVVLVNHPAAKEPGAVNGVFVSSKGRSYDTTLAVAKWIPRQMSDGTLGQIYSVTMSDDHASLAVTGGWKGRDERGHNGIFLLRREPQHEFDYWRLQAWFEVPGMTIGEIEFGPDDTLLTTSHEINPTGADGSLLTLFTLSGQRLGSFIAAEHHGAVSGASFCRLMRIKKIGRSQYAIYDPENAMIRHVAVDSGNGRWQARQTSTAPLSALGRTAPVIAFDALPDGREILAWTVIENRHGRTLVSVLDAEGRVLAEWQSPRVWRYGCVKDHQIHGFYSPEPGQASTAEIVVAVK